MTRHSQHESHGALFVAAHRGTRYTLVCLDDGRYAIAADGRLLPPRWRMKNFGNCFRYFMQLSGQSYQELRSAAGAGPVRRPADDPEHDGTGHTPPPDEIGGA